jgi:uncharacterized protein (DUF362 family)
MTKPRVIIRRAPAYDPAVISRLVREGLEELGLAPRVRGRVTIKPNVVMAHSTVAPSAFTRPEFLEGLASAVKAVAPSAAVSVVEKCGTAVPTSRMFTRAGYRPVAKRLGLRLVPIEEARRTTARLERGVVHKTIRTAREIVDRDFLIYAPKLKTNVLAGGLTAALKLNIGILCDRERMWNHNGNLDDKIVDLLEVGRPDFIATDAVEIAMGGNQMTQHGRPLGIVVMADDPLAHDVVCAHIFHRDPNTVRHLVRASERGYGSLDLAAVELSGDISLDEVRAKTAGWETGPIRVEDVDCGFKVLCGEPVCRGGCHGVFLDWLYMIKDRKPKLWASLPAWTAVIGEYEGDVDADRLLLIGTCTKIKGRVRARKKCRINGCPPKHKKIVLGLLLKAGIVNPLFRPDLIYDAYVCLFFSWVRRFLTGRL